jgi:hypothetical protein
LPNPMMLKPGMSPQKTLPQAMDESLSVMNPQDAFLMAERGMLRADMSVRELFSTLGVDVEGPVTQLSEMVQRETQKANPLNKMKAAAAASPMADPVAAKLGNEGGMPFSGSLEDLMYLGGR